MQTSAIDTITRNAFSAYNAGGPPERVRHKWACAASAAASAGAEAMYAAMLGVFGQDAARIAAVHEAHRRVMASLAAPSYEAQ